MELHEKIRNHRKEKGLSQEELASKIYVSRTLISKYENGSVFPTEDNLAKLAEVFEIDPKELMSDQEKNEIVIESYNKYQKLWAVICFIVVAFSFALLLLSIIPYYQYSYYDYANVTHSNPTSKHVTGFTSIIASTLKNSNPIALINMFILAAALVLATLNFFDIKQKTKSILRIISLVLLIISLVLFFFAFAAMVSINADNY